MSSFPQATPHGEIERIFDDVFFVTGSVEVIPGMTLSRNMIILREEGALTLISPVRLNDNGLKQLDALGTVKHVVKLGNYHLGDKNGLDDEFYLSCYNAKFWALPNMTHKGDLVADELLTSDNLPVGDAKLFVFPSSPMPEGILILKRESGVAIAADSLQNWDEVDSYFSEKAGDMMQKAGFICAANIGPEWRRVNQPDASDFDRLFLLDFEHVLPSHGKPLLNDAKNQYQATANRLFAN